MGAPFGGGEEIALRRRLLLLAFACLATGCLFLTYDGMEPQYPPHAFPTLDPPPGADPATVTTGTVTLPTCRMEDISWLPSPFATDDVGRGYPYLRSDRNRIQWNLPEFDDRTWRTVVLENEYLKVTLLGELGGRLFEAIFKPTGKQVFFREKQLKPFNLWNCGKEWMFATGGLRFEFPGWGHDPNTEEPWEPTLRTFPNGTASVTFARTDVRTGLSARVHVSLDPGRSWIRLNMEIENPTDHPQRAGFWTITGLEATPGIEFIVPTEFVIYHGGEETFRWPVSRGADWTYFRNWPDMQSFFALDWKSDFSGLYDHIRDTGVVRWARPQDTPGLKLWGAPRWRERYYVSIYGGIAQTMEEKVTLKPGQVRRWEETWYPLAGTKGLTHATREVAVSLHRRDDDLVLGVLPTRIHRGATLRIVQADKTLLEKTVDLTPNEALVQTVPLKGKAEALTVRITRDDGRALLEKSFELKGIRPVFERGTN